MTLRRRLWIFAVVLAMAFGGEGELVETAPRLREEPTIRFAPWVGLDFESAEAGSAKLLSPTPLLRAEDDIHGDSSGSGAIDPKLEALSEVRERMWIARPLEAGPAIDWVPETHCLEFADSDQLGAHRPQGPACDIGAVERPE